jgi:hypothetical protein
VNEFLAVAIDYITHFPNLSDDVDQLLFGILQGRFALLEHNMTFDYDFAHFKFYKFARQYIRTFHDRSAVVVHELVDWIDAISTSLVPKLISAINTGVGYNVFDDRLAGRVWHLALDRLKREWDNTTVSLSLLALLVNVRCVRPSSCNLDELMEQLQFMWEAEDSDEEILSFLPVIFLDLAVNEEGKIPVGNDIIEQILELIGKRQFDWNYAKMVSEVIVLLREKGTNYDVWYSAAMMFAAFLTLNDEELGELKFTAEMVQEMGGMLNLCISEARVAPDAIRAPYARFPAKLERLDMVLEDLPM